LRSPAFCVDSQYRQLVAETDSRSDDETDSFGSRSLLRFGAIAGGAGLVVSYALPWVAVTGETVAGGSGSISARELELVPELAAALGVIAVGLTALYWTTRTQVVVLLAGLAGTGVSLFGWFFLDSNADLIRLGDRAGPPGSFDPAVGLMLALFGSFVLVAAGFLGVLRTLPD
jgi:hypothetical protein